MDEVLRSRCVVLCTGVSFVYDARTHVHQVSILIYACLKTRSICILFLIIKTFHRNRITSVGFLHLWICKIKCNPPQVSALSAEYSDHELMRACRSSSERL